MHTKEQTKTQTKKHLHVQRGTAMQEEQADPWIYIPRRYNSYFEKGSQLDGHTLDVGTISITM
jgi:hypothetical protein